MIRILLRTFWAAPFLAFFIFVLQLASAMLRLFPLPYYLGLVWQAAVVLQVAVLLYQVLSRRYKVALASLVLLALPYLCYSFLATQ